MTNETPLPADARGLTAWRKRRRLNRGQLAEVIGCGINRPKQLEEGRSPITLEFRLACAAIAYGLPPIDFARIGRLLERFEARKQQRAAAENSPIDEETRLTEDSE